MLEAEFRLDQRKVGSSRLKVWLVDSILYERAKVS
jgi:hypothetical protein